MLTGEAAANQKSNALTHANPLLLLAEDKEQCRAVSLVC